MTTFLQWKKDLPGLYSVCDVLNQISDNFMFNVIQHPHSEKNPKKLQKLMQQEGLQVKSC